jgi:hypothetical protein
MDDSPQTIGSDDECDLYKLPVELQDSLLKSTCQVMAAAQKSWFL